MNMQTLYKLLTMGGVLHTNVYLVIEVYTSIHTYGTKLECG